MTLPGYLCLLGSHARGPTTLRFYTDSNNELFVCGLSFETVIVIITTVIIHVIISITNIDIIPKREDRCGPLLPRGCGRHGLGLEL